MTKRSGKIPSSVLGRTGRLLLSGAKIATREVAGRIAAKVSDAPESSKLATKVRQTQELVQTLSQLKGAAMKAGQLLSLELSDLLPPEVTEVLRQLHDAGTFMPFDQVRWILGRELGAEKLSQLEELSPQPVAAASIGQVHKAMLNGKPVAVKVQFPGVAKTIDADLGVLRKIAGTYLQLQGKDIDLDEMFAELALGLKKEADYRIEAAYAKKYAAVLTDPRFVVPQVVEDFSTERVITLSFEEGIRLHDWLKGAEDIEWFCEAVLDLIVQEFFTNGLVQTDPNYGNFLCRPKERKIVLLDFGATNEYPVAFRREIQELMKIAVEGDEAKLVELTCKYGLMDARESDEVKRLYLEMMRHVAAMFKGDVQPFDYADETFLLEIRQASMAFVGAVEYSAPARQVIFLNRKLGGMFHLLKDAGAKVDMRPFYERAVSKPIE